MDSNYYSTIYNWFERCGVISNIRTHLRQNLVDALKGAEMARNKAKAGPKSAKQYVYDLLIAEYLWNHAYVYTLSVFASETPLLINFHKHISQIRIFNDGWKKHKLETDYIWHALETLGIKPEGPSGHFITNEYINNDIPLLLSILKYISHSQNIGLQECIYPNGHTQNFQTQTDRIEQKLSTDCGDINSLTKKLMHHKRIHACELEKKENQLKKLASTIEQQAIMLNEKLFHVKNAMQVVEQQRLKLIHDRKENENYIQRKNIELSIREKSLVRREKRLEEEKDSSNIFERNLKRLQDELRKIQRNVSTTAKDPPIPMREFATQTQSTDEIIIDSVVDEEKHDLQSLVQEQQSRIEILTMRAVHLSRQLTEAHLIKCPSFDIMRPSIYTILSESSSTDEIIQDAKQRLKRLEEESFRADECLKNCMAIA